MKTPVIDMKTWCIGKGALEDYEVVRIIQSSFKWTSYIARDKSGKRVTLTFIDNDRMLEKYKFLAYQNGAPIEEAENEALERIRKYQDEIMRAADRAKGFGSDHVAATLGYSQDRERGQLVVISEYTPGIELNYLAARLNPKQQIFLYAQVLKGIEFIHKSGFLHLNVKPSRVFVDVDGVPPVAKLTNFGFAIPKTGYDGELGGTLSYIAPEVALDKRDLIGERSDLYSFGVTMYNCLTGHEPFEDRREAEMDKAKLAAIIERETSVHAPPSQFNRDVPKELDEIVMSLLEKDPAKRKFGSAGDLNGVFLKQWPEECSAMKREGTTTLAIFD